MITLIDLSTEGPTSEGLRGLLGRSTGHLVSFEGTMLVAEAAEELEEWIDLPLVPEVAIPHSPLVEAIEVETRQVSETVSGTEITAQSETVANQEGDSTETDGSDDTDSGADGPGGTDSGGDLIDEGSPVATRSDVVARIRTRALSYTKTTGARQTRRNHRSGRSLQ